MKSLNWVHADEYPHHRSSTYVGRYTIPSAFIDPAVSLPVLECCAKVGIRASEIWAVLSALAEANCENEFLDALTKLVGDCGMLTLFLSPKRLH
jgi:hypothetical protein